MSYNRAHVCVYIICVSYNVKNIFACIYACLCNVTILVKVELEVIIVQQKQLLCLTRSSILRAVNCIAYTACNVCMRNGSSVLGDCSAGFKRKAVIVR